MPSIKSRSSALLSVCVLLSGCASMEAVQKYADYSRSTIESVKPVAEDFQASCLRANSAKPFANYNKCSTEQEASKAILMVSNVLSDYGAALGQLAADELVNYDKDIDGLTGEIKNLRKIYKNRGQTTVYTRLSPNNTLNRSAVIMRLCFSAFQAPGRARLALR